MTSFPKTSFTLLEKFKTLPPGQDGSAWARFWDSYSLAIRQFAVFKGGAENADDIVMTVLGKLVEVLRAGQYTPEKGAFHSYLATMIVNEVRMQHRKDEVRKVDCHISIDSPVPVDGGEGGATLVDVLPAAPTRDSIEEDWKRAVLESAVEYVLTKTALSERDRKVYRAYVQENRDIDEVARMFKISRNAVSQIKTRISKRIITVGRELVDGVHDR
ncbi:MAG: sigma-70 family RNA polymerase sigma factor [Kiritimatiellae bacterium]|nr:sigma-70 family RNA polymerase sigma factor [Kiritimatiellia bacterium]